MKENIFKQSRAEVIAKAVLLYGIIIVAMALLFKIPH